MRFAALTMVGGLLAGLCLGLFPVCAQDATAAAPPNLLANPGLEAGEKPWEMRSPSNADRTLSIVPEAARTGKLGARIVNLAKTDSRWRQGGDQSIRIEPGSTIRLSGWIRTDLTEGYAALRIYGMADKDNISAQPTSRTVIAKSDWTRCTVNLKVPERTEYIMAYLELVGAVGTADYDDLELVVMRPPTKRQTTPDMVLLTNAPADDATVYSLRTLYPGRLVDGKPGEAIDAKTYRGLIAFERGSDTPLDMAAIEAFVKAGGKAVVDLATYARARALTIQEQPVAPDQATLRIAAEHPVTAGYQTGNTIPWYGGDRAKPVRRSLSGKVPGTMLGEAPDGSALLVVEQLGQGTLLATDLAGLPEPVWNQPGYFNKYLFAGNLLGNSVRYGRHFEKKLTYAEFVAAMRALAERYPAVRVRDEGPASDGQPMITLSLGQPDKPAMFVYAAAHGSEWEPGYGLLALAERLAEKPDEGLFDFQRYRLVLLPLLNPAGYDARTRGNGHKVDLNRNGDTRWQEYNGRPNAEGTYGLGSYDWKGTGPFSEPETGAWKRVLDREQPVASLDFHGNAGGAGNNRLIFIPSSCKPENEERVHDAAQRFNEAIADRFVLHEAQRPGVQQYEIETISWESIRPTLITTACRDRLGFVVEVPAGYAGTYGTVVQTDIVIETCLAFFRACE